MIDKDVAEAGRHNNMCNRVARGYAVRRISRESLGVSGLCPIYLGSAEHEECSYILLRSSNMWQGLFAYWCLR